MSEVRLLQKLFARKQIQIGQPTEKPKQLSDEFFNEEEHLRVLAKRTEDCEYPILERVIQPTKTVCPACREITLAGLEYCDKCGTRIRKDDNNE